MKQSKLTRAIPPLMLGLITAAFTFLILYLCLLSVLPVDGGHLQSTELREYNYEVISYLKGTPFGTNTLDFLAADEQAHMTDVKLLFDMAFILALLSLSFIVGMLIVFFTRMREHVEELIGRTLQYSGTTMLVICLLFGLAALFSFERFWVLFHVFLFPQGNWLFATDSLLIQLYPTAFFESTVMRYFAQVLGIGIISLLLGIFMKRMWQHEELFLKGKF